jgi:hypothetical protein
MDASECPEPDGVWQAPALEAVRESIVWEAVNDLDRPHIVLINDPELDVALVLGPFPDALSATVGAETQRREDVRELGESGRRTYRVLLLLPPMLAAV